MPEAQEGPLKRWVAAFLASLEQANRSPHTRRAYTTDLAQWCTFCPAAQEAFTADDLRAFFAQFTHLRAATRARKRAALSSFFAWAYRQELIPADPMLRIDPVKHDEPLPRALSRPQIEQILATIPPRERRDRLLFRLLVETGLRVGEALGIEVADLDLTPNDEHLRVLGKGGHWRTVVLDDPRLVAQLRAYLRQMGYRHGPVFRAVKNSQGGALRYQSVQERWASYCTQAGIACTLHQLRHSHATELVNAGVSLATIRKRLGHRSIQTTLRYAEQTDTVADTEVRTWRRTRRGQA